MYTVRITKKRVSTQLHGNMTRGQIVPNLTRDYAYWLVGQGVAEIIEGDDTKPNFETKGAPSP